MLIQDIFFWLQFSALVLVHFLLLVLILLVIQVFIFVSSFSKKIARTMDKAEETIEAVSNKGLQILDETKEIVASNSNNMVMQAAFSWLFEMFMPRKQSFFEKVLKMVKK
jgi:hypothetical protein